MIAPSIWGFNKPHIFTNSTIFLCLAYNYGVSKTKQIVDGYRLPSKREDPFRSKREDLFRPKREDPFRPKRKD